MNNSILNLPPVFNRRIIQPALNRNVSILNLQVSDNLEVSDDETSNIFKRDNLLNNLSNKLENDNDLKELSNLVQDIDKNHYIKLEEEECKNNNLKREIKNLKEHNKNLNKFKTNYKHTITKLPTEIIKEKISNNKCSICLEDKTKIGKNILLTSCFHVFHEECLKESMKTTSKCPLCRFDLNQSFYKEIQIDISFKDVSSFN